MITCQGKPRQSKSEWVFHASLAAAKSGQRVFVALAKPNPILAKRFRDEGLAVEEKEGGLSVMMSKQKRMMTAICSHGKTIESEHIPKTPDFDQQCEQCREMHAQPAPAIDWYGIDGKMQFATTLLRHNVGVTGNEYLDRELKSIIDTLERHRPAPIVFDIPPNTNSKCEYKANG